MCGTAYIQFVCNTLFHIPYFKTIEYMLFDELDMLFNKFLACRTQMSAPSRRHTESVEWKTTSLFEKCLILLNTYILQLFTVFNYS